MKKGTTMRRNDLIWATCLSGVAACSPGGETDDAGDAPDAWRSDVSETPDVGETSDTWTPDDVPSGIDVGMPGEVTWHRCCFAFPGSMTRMTSGYLECSCPAGAICNYEIQTCFMDTGVPMDPVDTGFEDAGPMDDAAIDAFASDDAGPTDDAAP